MSKVPQDVWCDGYVIAYMSPIDEGVNYAFMDALCDKMHALEPRVKFDNREWLGRIHYILFLGDHALALEAFRRATAGDGWATWNECLDTKRRWMVVERPRIPFHRYWREIDEPRYVGIVELGEDFFTPHVVSCFNK